MNEIFENEKITGICPEVVWDTRYMRGNSVSPDHSTPFLPVFPTPNRAFTLFDPSPPIIHHTSSITHSALRSEEGEIEIERRNEEEGEIEKIESRGMEDEGGKERKGEWRQRMGRNDEERREGGKEVQSKG
jgi:hypothetical protein